eukprot:COSAG05_NODE_3832_length_1815_cov_4.222028_1_plen_403_part_00
MERLHCLQRHIVAAVAPCAAAERVPAIWGHSPGKIQQQQEEEATTVGASPGQPPTPMEEFQFDLNGYCILRGAISDSEVASINRALDELPRMKLGDWFGYAHNTAGPGDISLQQVYELGPAFERLIDHPAYFEKLRRFIGGNGWDNQNNGGLLTIDEAFANFRATGGGIPMHGSGGADGTTENPPSMKAQYRFANNTFLSGQINMALALSDIGPGDGATMLLPGSHKANLSLRNVPEMRPTDPKTMEGVPGAIEVHMNKGDVLLFVDSVMHGGARKTSPGVRRTIWYRYTTAWSRLRYGYKPSRELCERLTPRRAAIVDPHYAKMLERHPQVAQPTQGFNTEEEPWGVAYLHETRVQQKEAVAGLTRAQRLALQTRRESGEKLSEEETKALAIVEDFDATSH